MDDSKFRIPLYLPAQGAAESDATIIEWYVAPGDTFEKGQALAQVDSAKSVFDFEAPCDGRVVRLHCQDGEIVTYEQPVLEIATADQSMRDWTPPSPEATEADSPRVVHAAETSGQGNGQGDGQGSGIGPVVFSGFGSYLPKRVVTNAELCVEFPSMSDEYVQQVTGIRQRHWAADDEKPSDMAYAAALEAIARSGLSTRQIGGMIVATTTPDVAMPSTACIVQDRLNLADIPAFDLNAACSGWLYAVSMARGMIVSGIAEHVLCIGVDVQSRLLDRTDQSTCFIFGDGAGAAIISADDHRAPRIREVILGADTRGLNMARRQEPGYTVSNGHGGLDPFIRLEGHALFRFATESFAELIRRAVGKTRWRSDEIRWVVPHQANGRILKAAARRTDIPFDRFYLNVDRVGNTSSASIPLAIREIEESLETGDRLILCSVGAGVTTAALSVEW